MRSQAWCWAGRCAVRIRNRALRTFDSMIGVALQMVAVLVAAWMLATPLTSSDQPNLAAAVRGSKVLAQVDEVAPSWLRSVPTRLSALLDTSGLPDVLQTVRPHPDRRRRRPGCRAGHRRRRGRHPAERGEDPRRRPGLPEGARGHRFRRRAEPGDVQRARGRGLGQRHRRGRRPDLRRGVVSYDPEADISILDVPDLPSAPLSFAEGAAPTGTDAIVMGYPGGGDFAATPGAYPRDHRAQRPRHLPHHHRDPRGVHDQRHCAAR